MFRVAVSSSVDLSNAFLVKGLLLAALYPFCFPCATVSAQQAQPPNETLRGLDPRVMDIGADPCVTLRSMPAVTSTNSIPFGKTRCIKSYCGGQWADS